MSEPVTSPAGAAYPTAARDRDRWILQRRGQREHLDPWRPYAFHVEPERGETGGIVSVATVFLVNRECPFRCVMCDLWRYTLEETVPAGAIPAQIDHALANLPRGTAPRQIKLYNAGSFFDPRAIPVADHDAIACRVASFERVIVECHPAFVDERVERFRDLLVAQAPPGRAPALEVALGLETAYPEVLARLNKRMTLEQFRDAAQRLRTAGIAVRAFVLVQPPFLPAAEAVAWAARSAEFAFDAGAGAVTLIPTRVGNGALEALVEWQAHETPTLRTLETAFEAALVLRQGRVFVDLWDLERFSVCPACCAARKARLNAMNLEQTLLPRVRCERCGG